jgi:arabinose-5-phosphate isomerase
VLDALVLMTESKLGAIIVLDDKDNIYRIFTDGDLRRLLKDKENIRQQKLSTLKPNSPVTVDANSTLFEVQNKFVETKVDSLIVVENNHPVGIVDVQDIL